MATSGIAEIQQVGKTSKTHSMKGKEIASRETRPPLNFLSILHNAKKTIDTSCPDKLCEQLYTGVFLKDKELKYFVDEKTNKNCFMLFARKLNICWIDHSEYWKWKWIKEETSGEEIEVAELREVCWLDIRGKFDRTIDLSPGAMYEIVFVVRMIDDDVYYTHISNCTVTLVMILPRSRTQRNESLEGKPVEEWFEILVGEFIMSPENVGSVEFSMEEHGTNWKRGLIVKCAIIRPKK
ncbi:Protein PHLOEM PROTEIN 2-LIKE A1 [Camellia lanceoleosa]|uniref:Protein PHLOEM PROTEIN 2-LIKE A1 n=1 Tax=Camellia lanceoleosa TaxID=1840588 RepID=A0ACC0HSL0_9ERIC|nr:Protein PHLOEM PROTEIN 2-LIKE A1 [Camellia lanceoleosa]